MKPEENNVTPVDDTITPEATPPAAQPTTEPTTPAVTATEPAATQPMVTPVAAATPTPPASKSRKFKLAAIIAGVVLVLGGGSAAAYYAVVLPNQPQRIAQQAIANTVDPAQVKSGYFEGDVTFEGGEVSQAISGITFKGASNESGAMDLNVSVNTLVTKIGFDVKTEDGKTLYLKLSGLTGLDSLIGSFAGTSANPEQAAMIATLVSSVNDKWFMVDQSLLNQVGGGAAAQITNPDFSTEDAKKLGDIYKKHQFLNIDKKLEPQDIHGIPSHHIQALINKEQMIAFLNEVKSASIKSLPLEQNMIDELSKVDFSKYPFEMWVAKKEKLITQLATTIEDSGTKAKIRVALFDFNKDVKVEKPADARSILELISEFAPAAGGLLGASSSDSFNASDLPALNL